jgi:hypothetical protein
LCLETLLFPDAKSIAFPFQPAHLRHQIHCLGKYLHGGFHAHLSRTHLSPLFTISTTPILPDE